MTKDVYTIVDESTGDDLRLALQLKGKRSVTAGAPSDVVAQMQAQFGMRCLHSFEKNKLRYEAHAKLTAGDSGAEALLRAIR